MTPALQLCPVTMSCAVRCPVHVCWERGGEGEEGRAGEMGVEALARKTWRRVHLGAAQSGPRGQRPLLRWNAGAESWLDATADGSASLGLARLQNRRPGPRGPAHCSDGMSSCRLFVPRTSLCCDHTDPLSILKGTRHFCEFSSSSHSPTGAALRTKAPARQAVADGLQTRVSRR